MSGRKWTPSQLNAINADTGTVLVSAAAGSGKTAVLVERIVRLLTNEQLPISPSSLLVVTFTNAAAAEMRARIYKMVSDKMQSAVGEDRAKLFSILPHLDEMNVCTMDSFGIKLVRERFHECGVQSDFTLLDGGESDILKNDTAAAVVESVFADFPEKADSLAKLFQQGRTDERLIEAIVDLSDFSMAEPDPEKWLDGVTSHYTDASPDESEWGRIIADEVFEGLCEMKRLAAISLSELEECPELYTYKNVSELFNSVFGICERAVDSFPSLEWDEKLHLISLCRSELGELPSFYAPKGYKDHPVKLACSERNKVIKDFFKEKVTKLMCADSSEHAEDIRRLKPDAELLITAVKRFNAELLRRKNELNQYDFSDILHFALGLLYDPNMPDNKTPAAHELSEQFYEILIDEYQDTNRAQDMLFTCLSRDGNNLFTVGDVKQSIYRFRLASPEIFIEKSESYPYYDGSSQRSKVVLKNNFRSRNGVLAAINYMFDFVMSKECGEIEYNDDERLMPPPDRENGICTPDFEMHIIDDGDAGVNEEAEYTARLIKEAVKNGTPVHINENETRKADYGDFCILLRSAKDTASVFAQALRKNGVPVSVEAREGFFESAEIRLAVSLLHTVDNPLDDVSLLSVMMSPLFGFTPDTVAAVRIDSSQAVAPEVGLWGRICTLADNGDKRCAELRRVIRRLRRDASLENAAQSVRKIFDETGIVSLTGALTDGELRRANLGQLSLMAEAYSVDPSRTLGSFVRYIDALRENKASVKRASGFGGSSVRIMTMHGSKGLEFPFVVIAGAKKKFNSSETTDTLFTEHTLGVGLKIREPEQAKSYDTLSSSAVKILKKRASRSEELRVFYVALTRAREKLYVVAADKAESFLKKNVLSPSAEPISPYIVKNAVCPFDWFVEAFMHHPDAYCLRYGDVKTRDGGFPAVFKTVKAVRKQDSIIGESDAVEADKELTNELCDRMKLKYAHIPVAEALAKHTASTLREERFSPEFFGDKLPSFLCESGLSPSEIGTATHLFLQYCDFDAARISVETECERLVSCGRISREQAQSLDTDAVKAFVNGEICEEIRTADKVYREKRFTVAESICSLDKSVPKEFKDERTVIIGKIDLCYIKDGKAVIVDYKTDRVTDENVLVNRYREQLSLYIRAVEKTFGYNVEKCVLYSLKMRKGIDVPRSILPEFDCE